MMCAGRGRPASLCPRAPTKQGFCEASIPGGAGALRAEAGRQVASRRGQRPACLPCFPGSHPGWKGSGVSCGPPSPVPWLLGCGRGRGGHRGSGTGRACGRQAPGWSLLLQCQAGPRGEEPPPSPLLQTLPCCPQRLCQPQAVPVS